jgi:hypothetical protein
MIFPIALGTYDGPAGIPQYQIPTGPLFFSALCVSFGVGLESTSRKCDQRDVYLPYLGCMKGHIPSNWGTFSHSRFSGSA